MKGLQTYMVQLCCCCLLLVCSCFFMVSCKKFVVVGPPTGTIVYATAFEDDKTAKATVNGLYSELLNSPQHFGSYGLSLYPGLSADELQNTDVSATYDPFANNSLDAGANAVNSIWIKGYSHIFHANDCHEGLEGASGLTDSVKSRLLSEVKFIRAYCFFYFVNLYGDVPLTLTTDYAVNVLLPRAAQETVYQQIITDLSEAINLLPASYATTGRARVNRQTAQALLARVYLYRKEWARAEQYATAVIQAGQYSLAALNNVFLANSTETMWQLNPTGLSYNAYEGRQFIPSSTTVVPAFMIHPNLYAAFENGDNRKTAWMNRNIIAGVSYYYPYKYKVRTNPSGVTVATENSILFRLAEQYLIRAEARAELDNISGAQEDLNKLRNRAGLANTTANNKLLLLSAIEQERRVELFCETGHRWLDLKRRNRADAVLGPVKGANWQAADVLYPIPAKQIELNRSLTQNPGY